MTSKHDDRALRWFLWLRTGSVFVTSFAHACVNSWSNALALVYVGIDPVLGGPTGLVGIAVVAAVGGALLATRASAPNRD